MEDCPSIADYFPLQCESLHLSAFGLRLLDWTSITNYLYKYFITQMKQALFAFYLREQGSEPAAAAGKWKMGNEWGTGGERTK